MSIEIVIKADTLAAAIEKLADAITVRASIAKVNGGELQIPAGTPLTVTGVVKATAEPAPEPEKPKTRKRAAAKAPETPQEALTAPEAQKAEEVHTASEKPAEAPQSAAPAPTMEQIATAGARLLDVNPDAMTQLLELLAEYGVQAITQLTPEQLPGFADRLRGLGAEV